MQWDIALQWPFFGTRAVYAEQQLLSHRGVPERTEDFVVLIIDLRIVLSV